MSLTEKIFQVFIQQGHCQGFLENAEFFLLTGKQKRTAWENDKV